LDSPATCAPVSMAASPTPSAPAVYAIDNTCVSPRSYASSISDVRFNIRDLCGNYFSHAKARTFVNDCFSPKSCVSEIYDESICPEFEVETPSAEFLACQPGEATFSSLTIQELSNASMTCRESFVSLRPALKLREHSFPNGRATVKYAKNNIDQPASCLPVDTHVLSNSTSSESIIDSLRPVLGEYAFDSPATCVPVSMAASPTPSAPAVYVIDNTCVSPRSYTSAISDEGISPRDFCVRHFQASSKVDRDTPSADTLPPESLACQPCEISFSILTVRELFRASITCRKSFASLSPALKLRELSLFTSHTSITDAVSQYEAHPASGSYLAEALTDRFNSQELVAPCSFSFLPLRTLLSLASVSINLFAVTHPAVRFRRAQRDVKPVWLRNNVAVRRLSKGAVYYCTLCQATFLSQALCSVCECMICVECDGVRSQFAQFFNTPVRCVCVELTNACA